jgi:hypothetical protein
MFARYIAHILAHKETNNSPTWEDIEKIQSLY